jgi:hypothetical protein
MFARLALVCRVSGTHWSANRLTFIQLDGLADGLNGASGPCTLPGIVQNAGGTHDAPACRIACRGIYEGNRVCVLWMARLRDAFRQGGSFALTRSGRSSYSRSVKEVIQPQVPLRLPCYDFAPVTALAFGRLPLVAQVATRTSGAHSFHGVTGGVYKARERIHRGVADPRLLAIPASCRRVADDNPN